MRSRTLSDVARTASVSHATADRVLNRRGRLSERASGQVRDTVERLGHVRNVPAADLSQQGQYRFAFVLPDGGNAFFETIRRILSDRIAQLDLDSIVIDVHPAPAFNVSQLSHKREDLARHTIDGIAVVGLDATALSAWLIGTAHAGKPGLVQVVVGDLAARDHMERHRGFMDVLSRDFPSIQTLALIEGRDDPHAIPMAVQDVIVRRRQISGIYSVGADNAGLSQALQGLQKSAVVIVRTLVENLQMALDNGLVAFAIDQCLHDEVDNVLTLMRAWVDSVPPPLKPILPTVYVRDNLPKPSNERAQTARCEGQRSNGRGRSLQPVSG